MWFISDPLTKIIEINIISFRNLLSFVCAAILLTGSKATICSEGSDAIVCHITIKDYSTGGASINLENPRKTLKCILCNMYTLPEIISQNSNLVEAIDFSQSHIKTLQNTQARYDYFKNVLVFNLSHNEIDEILFTTLPRSFKYLKTLDISYNNIEIVYALNGLDRLSTHMIDLNLSHNRIISFESKCFRTKRQLQTIKLNNNRITLLSAAIFMSFKNLLILDLSFNDIAYIEEKVFANLTSLQTLKLDNNKLTTVPATFVRLVSLIEVDLSNNLFKRLDFLEHFLERLPKLKRIGISDTDVWALTLVERFDASGIVLELKRPMKRDGSDIEKRTGQALQPTSTQCILDDSVSWTAIIIAIGIMGINIILLVISIILLCKHYRNALNELRY